MRQHARPLFGIAFSGLLISAASAAPPITEPVDVSVTNPVLQVEVSNADPVPVAIAESPDDQVVLRFRFDSGDVCSTFTGQGVGHLEFADRSVDANPYTVPTGKALLIDHVSWQAFASQGAFTQGEYVTVSIGTRFGALLNTGTVVTSDVAAATYANGNENIDGGLLFRAGENVCISGGLRTGAVTNAGPSLNGTVLQGRLVDL